MKVVNGKEQESETENIPGDRAHLEVKRGNEFQEKVVVNSVKYYR